MHTVVLFLLQQQEGAQEPPEGHADSKLAAIARRLEEKYVSVHL